MFFKCFFLKNIFDFILPKKFILLFKKYFIFVFELNFFLVLFIYNFNNIFNLSPLCSIILKNLLYSHIILTTTLPPKDIYIYSFYIYIIYFFLNLFYLKVCF